MSGYDDSTGVFSLTATKALNYLRHNPVKKPIEDWCFFCIKLFTEKGFKVIRETRYGIDVVADDAQVWEVLTGKEATWGHANPKAQEVYEKFLNSKKSQPSKSLINGKFFTVTDIGKYLDPPVSAIKLNKILEEKGYQERINDSWAPKIKESDLYQLQENPRNIDKPTLLWNKKIIAILNKKD
jgi:hypothetical protein